MGKNILINRVIGLILKVVGSSSDINNGEVSETAKTTEEGISQFEALLFEKGTFKVPKFLEKFFNTISLEKYDATFYEWSGNDDFSI